MSGIENRLKDLGVHLKYRIMGIRKRLSRLLPVSATLLASTFLASAQPEWLDDDLVAHFRFDGTAKDESENGNHGVLGGLAFERDRNGENGKALYQGGDESSGAFLLTLLMQSGTDGKAFSFWLNHSSEQDVDASYSRDLIVFFENELPAMGIRARHDPPWNSERRPDLMTFWFEGGRHIDVRGQLFGHWNHWFVNYSASGEVMIYLNGVAPYWQWDSDPTDRISSRFGSSQLQVLPDPAKESVRIDDLKIFGRSFTEEEILSLNRYEDGDSDHDGVYNSEERRVGTNPDEPDTDSDGLSDYHELGYGSTYDLVFSRNGDWPEAKTMAEEMGGHLASVTSEKEQRAITEYMTSRSRNGRGFYSAWIGGSDMSQEGDWGWLTGEEWGYENWHNGEQWWFAGSKENENYLQIVSSSLAGSRGLWNDLPEEWSRVNTNDSFSVNYFLVEYGYTSDPLVPDTDGDGILDGVESLYGMNPNLADQIQQGIVETFPALELSLFTLRGINYQLQKSADLVEWADDGEPFEGEGGPSSIFVRQMDQQAFWRLMEVDGG